MADLMKIVLVKNIHRAEMAAALVGVPGGGIANIEIKLTENATNVGPDDTQAGNGLLPIEMIEALVPYVAQGKCKIFDTDGSPEVFFAVMAVQDPPLNKVIESGGL